MSHSIRPAGAAPGGRARSAALAEALRRADAFEGLPDGITRWRLAAALRAAAHPLGLTPSMLTLLLHYIDLSYDADWTPGAEPVIDRPLVELAEHLGRSERQVRNIERALTERGLLAFRDSGNLQRRGRRDRRTGRLLWAYGPTLAPLGARASEIVALAAETRRRAAELRAGRIALSAARRRLSDAMALAGASDGAPAAQAAAALAEARKAAATAASPEALQAVAARLTGLAATIERETNAAFEAALPAPTAEICFRLLSDTTPETRKVVARCERERTRAEASRDRICLNRTVEACGPWVRMHLPTNERPGWTALGTAATKVAPALGVRPEAWRAASAALGREAATACIILLERRLERNPSHPAAIRRPEAYLAAMVRRGLEGQLRLDASLRGVIARDTAEKAAG